MADHIIKKFRLLKMGMEFHFIGRRGNSGVAEQQFQLGDGHVGGADVPDPSPVCQFFHLTPGFHVILMNVWFGVGMAGSHVASRGW